MTGLPGHTCPARGCTQTVAAERLMCAPHWYMTPKPLRNRVWAAWQDGRGAGSDAHTQAILDAISAVNARLDADRPPT